MSHLDETNLLLVLESLSERGSMCAAAAQIGCCEQTLFNWINKSRRAEAAGDKESPFCFEWRDSWDYLHSHCRRARSENVNSIEGLLRMQTKEGVVETIFSPQTGLPVQATDPQFIGVSDDEMREQFLHPIRDRLMWHPPDENGIRQPVYATKTTVLAASLRARVASAILPKLYGDKLSITNQVQGSINHTFSPAAYVPRAHRLAAKDVVDAEYKELPAPEERPDIAALRAEWRKREADVAAGKVHTAPDDPTRVPVFKTTEPFRPDSEDSKEMPTAHIPEGPAAKQTRGSYPEAPEPTPQPSYARRTDPRFSGTRNPHDPANRAAKVK